MFEENNLMTPIFWKELIISRKNDGKTIGIDRKVIKIVKNAFNFFDINILNFLNSNLENLLFVKNAKNVIKRDAPKIKIGEIEINSWKKFEEKSDMKVKDFIKKYSEEFKDEISTIIYGACLLYADFMGNDSDLELNLSKLIIDKCKIDPRKESINLHVVGDNEDLPSIKFSLT